MPGARIRIPFSQQNLMSNFNQFEFLDEPAASLSDMVFKFLEDGDWSSGSEGCRENEMLELEDEGEEKNGNVEEDKSFWENQHQLLHATLFRTSSLESRIRSISKEALKEIRMAGTICGCGRPMAASCRSCLMAEVSSRLRNAGYNSAICKTRWRSSPDIPSVDAKLTIDVFVCQYNAGEHTFMDVIDNSSSKRGDISCSAAKKCMKEKKMHLGPWRKQRYMLTKWLGTACERSTSMPPLSMGSSSRLPRPKASMLTVDLKEMLPDLHCTAVAVV
ncbi:hypothetical protein DKX38_005563 [Salix brachista]|uniref:Uncharacterized protein n=1 Tax=Salix brachista TaxID=2182728 RepID=A0A5N5N320_9ROSI|nr:hypothetical protein DKX38_005563 [Salix brachista]